MIELTKQEKKILEGKLKKSFKQLIKLGFNKKELKAVNVEKLDIDDDKKNEILASDDAFLECIKASLEVKEEIVEEEKDEVITIIDDNGQEEIKEVEEVKEEKTDEELQAIFLEKAEEIMGKEDEMAEDAKEELPIIEEKEEEKKDSKKRVKTKKEDTEDDEEDDNEVDKEEDEALQGYNKKVLLKLKIASDKTQKFYSDLRNELRCYKALKFKSNNTGDTYAFKGKVVFKVTIFPKALKVYYALNPSSFDAKKYHHKNAKDIKKYETIPLLLRIGSDRSYKFALEILDSLIKKLKVAKSKVKAFDFMKDFDTTSKELLIENGGEELLRSSCSKDNSVCITDNLAKKCMMLRVRKPIEGEKKIAEISIGELSAAFKSSYDINLDLLKEVGLADKDNNYLKVTALNNCYRAINITADEYDPEVIRMVVVTGGSITKLVK